MNSIQLDMAFDIDMIKKVYETIGQRVKKAKEVTGKPLTLSEKILYSHLYESEPTEAYKRGESYVDFAPDRIACQDATAQMALLQFMQAGKDKVAVPTTVHCDHLIQAKIGAAADLQNAINNSNEVSNQNFEFISNDKSTKNNPEEKKDSKDAEVYKKLIKNGKLNKNSSLLLRRR